MDEADDVNFDLQLFVVGRSPKSETALHNLRWLCERFLPGRHAITVTDVLEDPIAAENANVVATPMLLRRSPPPQRRIVGDLSKTDVLLSGLGISIEPHRDRGGEPSDG